MRLPQDIVEKAKRLVVVRKLKQNLEKEEKELADVLRLYIKKNGKFDEKANKAVWNGKIKVYLEAVEKLTFDPKGVYGQLQERAFDFLTVKVAELKQAVKRKTVNMSEEQLERLASRYKGTPRVKVEIK